MNIPILGIEGDQGTHLLSSKFYPVETKGHRCSHQKPSVCYTTPGCIRDPEICVYSSATFAAAVSPLKTERWRISSDIQTAGRGLGKLSALKSIRGGWVQRNSLQRQIMTARIICCPYQDNIWCVNNNKIRLYTHVEPDFEVKCKKLYIQHLNCIITELSCE